MTTCEDVRPLLPDQMLGTLTPDDELEVRRHLRGCAACRRELSALDEGLGVFASTLERPTPAELRGRVLGVLEDEWQDGSAVARRSPRRLWALALAASIALTIVAGAFGSVQMRKAHEAEIDATRFRTILGTLGGNGFRVGELRPMGDATVEGSVIAYRSSHDQSFVLVFVRAPGLIGEGTMVVARPDGSTWQPGRIEFDGDGDAATWWVTPGNVGWMTSLTVNAPDGSPLATARIRDV